MRLRALRSPSPPVNTSSLPGSGFVIERILEPEIDEEFKAIDPIAYEYMRQFPQWWMTEASVRVI